MAERIGILGGTFNPVHLGHLVLAQDAFEQCEMDRLLLVPCAQPPHKSERALAETRHRLAMVEAAVEGDPHISASAMEVDRGGTSWTVESLEALSAEHPDAELIFIIGSDTVGELHSWRRIDDILRLCRFAIASRPGAAPPDTAAQAGLSEDQFARLRTCWIDGHDIGIASRDIRMRIAEGLSIRYLVPQAVEMYIAEHGLYAQ